MGDSSESEEEPFICRKLERPSQKNTEVLIDPYGFTYTKKEKWKRTTIWRCTVRNRTVCCLATVKEINDEFQPNALPHKHPPFPGSYQEVKKMGLLKRLYQTEGYDAAVIPEKKLKRKHFFSRPRKIPVEHEEASSSPQKSNHTNLHSHDSDDEPTDKSLRLKKETSPTDFNSPENIHFDFQETEIPSGFLRKDITIKSRRYIFFATDQQLHLLQKARQWYIETSSQVPFPFKQLLGVHAFIKQEDSIKKVPLLFVVMSREKKKDYKCVFRNIEFLLDSYRVKEILLSFDEEVWHVVRKIFPNVETRGCPFSFIQTVKRMIQECNLNIDDPFAAEYDGLKKLITLFILPPDKISTCIEGLFDKAKSSKMRKVLRNVHAHLIESSVWSPHMWSIFNRSISIHSEFDPFCHITSLKPTPFYSYIHSLFSQSLGESQTKIRVISDEKLKHHQKNNPLPLQKHIFQAWDCYLEGDISASILLKICSAQDLNQTL